MTTHSDVPTQAQHEYAQLSLSKLDLESKIYAAKISWNIKQLRNVKESQWTF